MYTANACVSLKQIKVSFRRAYFALIRFMDNSSISSIFFHITLFWLWGTGILALRISYIRLDPLCRARIVYLLRGLRSCYDNIASTATYIERSRVGIRPLETRIRRISCREITFRSISAVMGSFSTGSSRIDPLLLRGLHLA